MFDHLFSPTEIGSVKVKNRIYVTPHETNFVSDNRDYLPGERLATYCAERARGGASLVEVSMAVVETTTSLMSPGADSHFDPLHTGYPIMLTGRFPISGTDAKVVEGYSLLSKRVHAHGGKCFIEVASSGANYMNPLGVSQIPWPSVTNVGTFLPFTAREMPQEDIEGLVEAYGMAASYVKRGGLDGVDLFGTHGGLICEFLSPATNRRKDRYGGSLEGRMRFLLEVIRRVREYAGDDDFAVCMRLICHESFDDGIKTKDAAEMASLLDGRLDMITADFGYFPQEEDWITVPMYVEAGYGLKVTNPIRTSLKKTKLGVVGKYVDPIFAESVLERGQADMVAMTRALIADPELPNKAREGRLEDIRPCIGVLQDCWGRMAKGLPISCTVNPAVSREAEWGIGTLKAVPTRKKVLVIGGGVAGLETARIAAERGHKVVIYEKSTSLGGQAVLAGKLPGRENIRAIVGWIVSQLKKLNVEIRYGLEVTPEEKIVHFVLDEEKPDVVVIATGSFPIRTGFQPYTYKAIEGWDEQIVCADEDILGGKVSPGENIIVADSLSFIEAPGIAELLARKGKSVEVVTMHQYIATETRYYNHWLHLLPRLLECGVNVTPFTWVRRVSGRTVTLYNVHVGNKQRTVENVDNLILTTGRLHDDALRKAFVGAVRELYVAGDAGIAGARIGNAMYDAQKIGRAI